MNETIEFVPYRVSVARYYRAIFEQKHSREREIADIETGEIETDINGRAARAWRAFESTCRVDCEKQWMERS